MVTKLGRVVSYLEGLLSIELLDNFYYVVLQNHVTQKNHYTSIATVFMATKFDRTVTYLKGLMHIKLSNSLAM